MTTNINTENGVIKSVNIEFTPIEILTLKTVLNLNCVYTELTQTDRQTVEKMNKDLINMFKDSERKN